MDLDPSIRREGRYALRIASVVESPQTWGTIVAHRLPVWFKMRDVRLRGYVKREKVEGGLGGLWARIEQADGYPIFHEQGDWEMPATEDWTWYELKLDVEAESRELAFGGILTGTGKLWLDSLTLDVDGVPYAQAAEAAATTAMRLMRPTLEQGMHRAEGSGEKALLASLKAYPLVAVRVAVPGDRMSLEALERLLSAGDFDHLLIDAPAWPAVNLEILTEKMGYPPSVELARLLQPDPRKPWLVQGVGLGKPAPALEVMQHYYGKIGAEALVRFYLWDSLHRSLYDQLGQRLVRQSDLQQLRELTFELPTPKAGSEAYSAWRYLQQLERYYASGGNLLLQDSLKLASVGYWIEQHPHQRTLLLLQPDDYYPSVRSFYPQLRQRLGSDMFSVLITVGKGKALQDDGSIHSLPQLGPHCGEYYLQQHQSGSYWVDLRQAKGWWPSYLFWRAQHREADQQPFITANWREHCDLLLFLEEAFPAQPLRAKLRR